MIGASIDTYRMALALSCRSPDSWCRRFNVDNASLKSERSLNGPGSSRIIVRYPPFLSVSKVFCLRHMMEEIFLRKLVHLDTDLLHFDHVRVEMYEIQDRSKSDGGSLENAS